MPTSEKETVRDLLVQQAVAANEEATRSGGNISAERVEGLERLKRVLDIYNVVRPVRERRWPSLLIFVLTLSIVSLLLFARVPTTEIEVDATVSEVSVTSPLRQVLADWMIVSELGISGLNEIHLPGQPAQITPSSDGALALRLIRSTGTSPRSELTLDTLTIPAGTRVRLRYSDSPHQFRLSLKGPEIELRVTVLGSVTMTRPGVAPMTTNTASPRSILLRSGAGEVDLDLLVDAEHPVKFTSLLTVGDLSFVRLDNYVDERGSTTRPVSTILAGTIYFESLNGAPMPLRPAQGIRFDRSAGEIRQLQLLDRSIGISFHGDVQGMAGGSFDNPRSLSPTYLDWLKARHGLGLLWGTTVYLFGLFLGLRRWWGGR